MRSLSRWTFAEYTRGQQIALSVLLILILIVFGLPRIVHYSPPNPVERDDLAAQAAALRAQMEQASVEGEVASSNTEIKYFYFDPNTVSAQALQELGLNKGQATSWVKYRAGQTDRFQKVDDIAKLYVLSPEDVARLRPWVRIENAKPPAVKDKAHPREDFKREAESFAFDPNTVSYDELLRLGLQERQAAGFLRYRGDDPNRFKAAVDLDKLYILDDDLRAHLKPLVQITPVVQDELQPAPTTYEGVTKPVLPTTNAMPFGSIDLNRATAEELQQLRGIGPYWSGRIIKYRDALGGFYSIAQLATTYGFPDSTYQQISPFLNLNTKVQQTIRINKMPVDELMKHPYLTRKQASVIVNYRAQHGPYKDADDLAKVRILTATQRERLLPYVDYN